MHPSNILCLLVALTASKVVALPWKWPWEGAKCDPWDEKGTKWSMQYYEKDNCEDKIGRIDSKSEGYKTRTCYKFGKDVKSFHGIAHEPYVLEYYSDEKCKKYLRSSSKGRSTTLKSPNDGKVPKSFMVRDPNGANDAPWPRAVRCGQRKQKEDPDRTQAKITADVCEKVLKKCNAEKPEYGCPSSKVYWGETIMDQVSGNPWAWKNCRMENIQMQDWFDSFCEQHKDYSCLRFMSVPGDSQGRDLIWEKCDSLRYLERYPSRP